MRLSCFNCGMPVTSDIPDGTIFRAIATCPECISKEVYKEEELAKYKEVTRQLKELVKYLEESQQKKES